MPASPARYRGLLEQDPRFRWEAYKFVEDALLQAQRLLRMSSRSPEPPEPGEEGLARSRHEEPHLTGQELCEVLRRRALEQYGYLAKAVLGNWGVHSTSDFGEIVYNLIGIDLLKKSPGDRREDFDGVYDFDQAFQRGFRISLESDE